MTFYDKCHSKPYSLYIAPRKHHIGRQDRQTDTNRQTDQQKNRRTDQRMGRRKGTRSYRVGLLPRWYKNRISALGKSGDQTTNQSAKIFVTDQSEQRLA